MEINQTIGRGAYGKVMRGHIKLSAELKVAVAIKTCTRNTGLEDVEREVSLLQITSNVD